MGNSEFTLEKQIEMLTEIIQDSVYKEKHTKDPRKLRTIKYATAFHSAVVANLIKLKNLTNQ